MMSVESYRRYKSKANFINHNITTTRNTTTDTDALLSIDLARGHCCLDGTRQDRGQSIIPFNSWLPYD